MIARGELSVEWHAPGLGAGSWVRLDAEHWHPGCVPGALGSRPREAS